MRLSHLKWVLQALGLNKRGKNTIEISMPDSMTGNLSIAVTDKGIGTDSSNNIIAQLLTGSELKGNCLRTSILLF